MGKRISVERFVIYVIAQVRSSRMPNHHVEPRVPRTLGNGFVRSIDRSIVVRRRVSRDWEVDSWEVDDKLWRFGRTRGDRGFATTRGRLGLRPRGDGRRGRAELMGRGSARNSPLPLCSRVWPLGDARSPDAVAGDL